MPDMIRRKMTYRSSSYTEEAGTTSEHQLTDIVTR